MSVRTRTPPRGGSLAGTFMVLQKPVSRGVTTDLAVPPLGGLRAGRACCHSLHFEPLSQEQHKEQENWESKQEAGDREIGSHK